MELGILLVILLGIFLSIAGIIVYFLPAFIAFRRDHPNKVAITLLNFFLGATLIVWVVCLVWALAGPPATIEETGYPHQ